MRDPHNRIASSVPFSSLLVGVCCAALAILLSSCGASLPGQREGRLAEENVSAVAYSIVCVIHGDGDYLYHDTTGTEYKADEEALAAVQRVAQQNPGTEVFIFHQKPRRHFLLVFPRHDGEFYYYRNGTLIANELYWRDEGQTRFDPELKLYRRFRAVNKREKLSVFLYCGHEIPEFGGEGYDASYPDRPFTVRDLAGALKSFTPHSSKFDLLVLSTCFGGTPYTIDALGSSARYIIASPGNLHLSYFDLHPLERLDLGFREGNVSGFAKVFAQQAFDRLTRDVQTSVSVAVYDVQRAQDFLHSVRGVYDDSLTALNRETQASMAAIEHCDCADIPAYMLPTMNEGVDVFYRPARFGRSKHIQSHSGWECWRQAATSVVGEKDQR